MVEQLDDLIAAAGPPWTLERTLELIWNAYERDSSAAVDRPPTQHQREAVKEWLLSRRGSGDWWSFLLRLPALTPLVQLDVGELASTAVQLGCRLHGDANALNVSPGGISFYVDAPPWSAQSAGSLKVATREAVSSKLAERGTLLQPWGDRPVCLTVSAVVPKSERVKDVDNLVKGLLDALSGYLYPDDRVVSCLTVRRFEYNGNRGYYLLHAIPVRPTSDLIIVDDGKPPIFA